MDIVFIEGLCVDATIGVFDWERKIKQRLRIDLEMAWDIRQAASTDDLQYALDYKAVSDRISEHVAGTEYELLESLAEELSELLLNDFSISWLRMKLSKPGAVPTASNVGLLIERGQRGDR
ncbi:dihydroneopterin aldolase [Pseudoteredinibacter isoporae]|uniref:dihydroneopterin aldolase n=1 Tax=Pseudoteredinibacter isoporae TaxID=570281 RepID=UPI003107E879